MAGGGGKGGEGIGPLVFEKGENSAAWGATATETVPVDHIGLALLVVWIGALQMMRDLGRDADWLASDSIVALCIIAAIGFIGLSSGS